MNAPRRSDSARRSPLLITPTDGSGRPARSPLLLDPDQPGRRRATPSGPTFGRTLGGWDVLAGLGVALAAVAIALAYRSALVPTDPWHYVQGALQYPEPTWRPSGLTRWGFLLAIVPFASLWGDAEATYYAVPLISTGVLAAVLYLLGTRYVARLAGLLGAVLALSTPIVFVNLTRGYADVTATMLVALALLLATLAADAAREGAVAGRPWGWRVPVLLVACGFVTGWSFEVRETAVFAWPVIGLVLLSIRRPLATLAWFAPPALAWLVVDVMLCSSIYGDPWIKLRILTGADISASEVSSDSVYVGQSRWWYVTILPRSLWELSGGPVLVAALLVGAVGGWFLRAHLGRLWGWGMLTLLLLWAQGGPLSPEHPSVRLDVARYWLSFIIPLMLCAVGVVVIVVRRTLGEVRVAALALGGAALIGMLVPAARFAATYPGFAPNGGDAMSELRDELTDTGGMPAQRVWADWATQRILHVYEVGPFGDPRWEAFRIRSLSYLLRNPPARARGYPRPGDYVLLYSVDDRTCWHCRRALKPVEAAFGPFPAEGWQEAYASTAGNLVLYRLGPDVQWPVLPGDSVPAAGEEEDTGHEPGVDGDPVGPGSAPEAARVP